MRVHILGICGTFMGGIAAIAREAGHVVSGSDYNVYPPMSTQLETLGIRLTEGWDPAQLDAEPDVVIVGNALSRGNPVIEALLNRGLPYTSGPEWLASHVLQGRWVLAVAGTHGKTTTAGLLAWILEHAGLEPGFLIGGVPGNFTVSARLGAAPFFVVEADEYDTAFFDKRAKFVHYRPQTAILNNLEYDHADIYPDVASIRRMFHQLVRTVPGEGRLIVNAEDAELAAALALGAWTPVERFGRGAGADWQVRALCPDWSEFEVWHGAARVGAARWQLIGAHNAENALAAVLAARHAGVPPAAALEALASFKNARRRMEVRGSVRGVTVYDDFAHHPTAIAATIEALQASASARPGSSRCSSRVRRPCAWACTATRWPARSPRPTSSTCTSRPTSAGTSARRRRPLGARGRVIGDVDALAAAVAGEARDGDHVLVMSNGGFGGLHGKLLALLGTPP